MSKTILDNEFLKIFCAIFSKINFVSKDYEKDPCEGGTFFLEIGHIEIKNIKSLMLFSKRLFFVKGGHFVS
jgi:hypothetical protein